MHDIDQSEFDVADECIPMLHFGGKRKQLRMWLNMEARKKKVLEKDIE